MKFSFVIPTYNNKILLKNTLEALNYQEGYGREDYEAVVVDDGSSDNTREFIEGINRNYSLKYIYLDRNADSCRSRTRNFGWKNASGEFIAFIDSDIVVKSNYLKELDRCFSIDKDILVTGTRLMLDEKTGFDDIVSKKIFERFNFDKMKYHLLEYRHYLYATASYNAANLLWPWVQVYSCNMAVSKNWLTKVGGFDENFKEWGVEDLEIGYSLYKSGVKMVINSRQEVLHQYHGPRNDLVIGESKIEGHKKNIDYFLSKHPEALGLNRRIAYKILKGDLSTSKILTFDMNPNKTQLRIDFKDKEKLSYVKELLTFLIQSDEVKISLYDHVEDTDLDIWVQLLDTTKTIVKYYPVSKQIDIQGMTDYINEEKERQKNRGKTGGESV
jgi:glycosyltransferase involved in cell wall biosynthesis